MFEGLSISGFTFDIKIDSVIMLPFDELGLKQNRFQAVLAEEILKHPAAAIKLAKDVSFCNNDLKDYQTALLGTVAKVISDSSSFVDSMNWEIFNSYVDVAQKATKAMSLTSSVDSAAALFVVNLEVMLLTFENWDVLFSLFVIFMRVFSRMQTDQIHKSCGILNIP
ncbi:hypothetical protein CPB97_007002 [Podila verticillata]|nr:hypothetical protein CPB97_007002 [Podila verticillata]